MSNKIFTPQEAKPMIEEKVDEIFEIFSRIDHPGRLALSVSLHSDYKTFAVYDRDDISGGDIIGSYDLMEEGYSTWGRK